MYGRSVGVPHDHSFDSDDCDPFPKKKEDTKSLPTGWVCPKCGAVLSPYVQFCACSLKVTC